MRLIRRVGQGLGHRQSHWLAGPVAAPVFVSRVVRMHELAITEGIVSGVLDHVPEGKVTRVIVEVGRLSLVVPDSLRFFFEACTQGTRLEGAHLEIVDVPGRSRCSRCGKEDEAKDLVLACPCGSVDVELISGQQLMVKAVEVV